jgi:hypothetical protein
LVDRSGGADVINNSFDIGKADYHGFDLGIWYSRSFSVSGRTGIPKSHHQSVLFSKMPRSSNIVVERSEQMSPPVMFLHTRKNSAPIEHLLQSQNKLNPNDCLTQECWIT